MNKKKKAPRDNVLAQNRKARHDYLVLDKTEAGIALLGTEVKSAREGRVQLRDSFVEFRSGEAFLVGAHFSPYSHGNLENHEPERQRKLLLHRRELDRLYGQTQTKGLTVVPLKLYLSGHRIKAELALVQGKKQHDRRQQEREKDLDREVQQAMRGRRV